VTGRLKLAEVDADHLGIMEAEALGSVVGHLQQFLEPPRAKVRPASAEDPVSDLRPIRGVSRPVLTPFVTTGPGSTALPPRNF
jgi:hypothetical protein